MPENATEERKRLLRLFGAEIVYSPGAEGIERSRSARARARGARAAVLHAVPVRERGEPARALRGNRRGDRGSARPRRRPRCRPRHGRNADGRGRAPARDLPRRRGRRGRAAPRRSRHGAALARRRLRAADPRRVEARPQGARLERGVRAARCGACSTRRGSSPACPPGRSDTSRASSRASSTKASSSRILADGGWKYLSADFWEADDVEQAMERTRLVVIPPRCAPRSSRTPSARRRTRRAGSSSCETDTAERYEPGRNAAASPYRFELEFDDPEIWFAEDDGYELAVFHSHLSAPARPSRTDVENIGLWAGQALPRLLAASTTIWPPSGSKTARSNRCRLTQ